MKRMIATLATGVTLFAAPAQAQTDVQLWHGMSGPLGELLAKFADDFNASQSEYQVTQTYKGNYADTLTAAIAAFRAGKPPAIVQVYEVGTASMMAAKGAVYPVHKLMDDTGEPFDPSAFIAPVFGYYSDTDGRLLSMPFNSSTPVMFWNKEHFGKAGLDPEKGPETWEELGEMAKTIIDAGVADCGLTVEYAPWTLLESQGTWHNMPTATQQNGFGGAGTELVFNDPMRVKLLTTLSNWQKDGRFKYYGREIQSLANFTSGECSFHFASSALKRRIELALGKDGYMMGYAPYFEEFADGPQNSLIGGATLWVLTGLDEDTYKGVAKFFTFLSSVEVQTEWHQNTGYVPITNAAYEKSKADGYYETDPFAEIAITSLTLNPPTEHSKGLRLGNFVQIREVEDSEMEALWAGQQTPEQTMDNIVEKGNALLRKFDAATSN